MAGSGKPPRTGSGPPPNLPRLKTLRIERGNNARTTQDSNSHFVQIVFSSLQSPSSLLPSQPPPQHLTNSLLLTTPLNFLSYGSHQSTSNPSINSFVETCLLSMLCGRFAVVVTVDSKPPVNQLEVSALDRLLDTSHTRTYFFFARS